MVSTSKRAEIIIDTVSTTGGYGHCWLVVCEGYLNRTAHREGREDGAGLR